MLNTNDDESDESLVDPTLVTALLVPTVTASTTVPTTTKDDDTKQVVTNFGLGRIVQHRSAEQIYEIRLNYGATLYAPSESIHPISGALTNENDYEKGNTADVLLDVSNRSNSTTMDEDQSAMELNVAYEALETMRKLNLEMTCQERNIPYKQQDLQTTCSACLLLREPSIAPSSSSSLDGATKRSFSSRLLAKSNNRSYPKAKVSLPCLICGTPICTTHSSKSFRKESIIMCCPCEELFGLSYVTQILTCTNHKERRQQIDRMIELYDRTLLLLRFVTTINFDHICTVLQQSTVRKNKVGIGSSSAGIVSGALGIAAASLILTPLGPPLIIGRYEKN
jgi:hypothetical protein